MKKLLLAIVCSTFVGCTTNSTTMISDHSKADKQSDSISQTVAKPTLPADRDNTGVNTRDRNDATLTPLDQNERQEDITITAEIRKQVIGKKMSINASNVKIITQAGRVTLRGPVEKEQEKMQIEEVAKAVTGVTEVDNQLEVR